jgi:hypothetical protein
MVDVLAPVNRPQGLCYPRTLHQLAAYQVLHQLILAGAQPSHHLADRAHLRGLLLLVLQRSLP